MTATPTAEQVQRPTTDVCPPWCAGHDANGYQGWEQFADGSIRRYHDAPPQHFGDVTVILGLQEVLEQGLLAPRVDVHIESLDDRDATELSDGDAHELGLAIVRAADTARRFRLAQEAGR